MQEHVPHWCQTVVGGHLANLEGHLLTPIMPENRSLVGNTKVVYLISCCFPAWFG